MMTRSKSWAGEGNQETTTSAAGSGTTNIVSNIGQTPTGVATETNVGRTNVESGAIPKVPQSREQVAIEQNAQWDESILSSPSEQSTVISPSFNSLTALGIREEFRKDRTERDNRRETEVASVGIVQAEIMRNVEERMSQVIPRLVQESISLFSQHTCMNYPNTQNATQYRPPSKQQSQSLPSQPSQNTHQSHQAPKRNPNTNTGPINHHQRISNQNFNQQRHFAQAAWNFPPPLHQPPPTIPHPLNSFHTELPRRIDKWGVKYDGTSKTCTVEDFVFRVETLQRDFGCTDEEVLRSFHHLLCGTALDWFWNHRRLYNVSKWDDLKQELISQFHRYESDFDIQRKILDRRQTANETFDDFCNAVLSLRNQQQTPISEQNLVEILKSNLKPAMSQLLFSVNVSSLASFRKEGRRAENLLVSQRHFNTRYPVRQINEIGIGEHSTDVVEVDGLNTDRKLVCWNCRAEGHTFLDCAEEQRRLFCYRCGMEGVVTPRCSNCQGNRRVNVPRAGEARSKMTQTQPATNK